MQECLVKELDTIEMDTPTYGNHILNLYPNKELPMEFKRFQPIIDKIFERIPHVECTSNQHYITIDSKYFPIDSSTRSEGLHADGNFCLDPTFGKKAWGGSSTWGGGRTFQSLKEDGITEQMAKESVIRTNPIDGKEYLAYIPFETEFGNEIPFGKYISSELGGIFCISDLEGCDAYSGKGNFVIGDNGNVEAYTYAIVSSMKKHTFGANKLNFMTSNTPHESTIIKKGNRRTLIRVTLAHDYPNKNLIL